MATLHDMDFLGLKKGPASETCLFSFTFVSLNIFTPQFNNQCLPHKNDSKTLYSLFIWHWYQVSESLCYLKPFIVVSQRICSLLRCCSISSLQNKMNSMVNGLFYLQTSCFLSVNHSACEKNLFGLVPVSLSIKTVAILLSCACVSVRACVCVLWTQEYTQEYSFIHSDSPFCLFSCVSIRRWTNMEWSCRVPAASPARRSWVVLNFSASWRKKWRSQLWPLISSLFRCCPGPHNCHQSSWPLNLGRTRAVLWCHRQGHCATLGWAKR